MVDVISGDGGGGCWWLQVVGASDVGMVPSVFRQASEGGVANMLN